MIGHPARHSRIASGTCPYAMPSQRVPRRDAQAIHGLQSHGTWNFV
jgi:hypothetical protein